MMVWVLVLPVAVLVAILPDVVWVMLWMLRSPIAVLVATWSVPVWLID